MQHTFDYNNHTFGIQQAGMECIYYDGRQVSKKFCLFGTVHSFSVQENGEEVQYTVTTGTTWYFQEWFVVCRNNNVIHSNNASSQHLYDEIERSTPTTLDTHNQNEPDLIDLSLDIDNTREVSETVRVPKGGTLKISRQRTINRSVELQTTNNISASAEAQIIATIKASLKGDRQNVSKQIEQESETVTYEITLNGDVAQEYKLTWIDAYLLGEVNPRVEVDVDQPVRFRIHQSSELRVVEMNRANMDA